MEKRNAAQDGAREFTYYAFISYKREDWKWALQLKQRLQSYRLTQKTHRMHDNLAERLSPIFLDKTNLTPGYLDEELRAEVQSSKFLIVVCSRAAKATPKYLDAEIQYFLDGGGTPDRIIPFIVDNSPRPEEACFPPRLAALNAEKTILGANIYDSGVRNAFLKVIAQMQGLRLEEVESEDTRRRRRNIALAVLATVLVLAAAALGGWYYWDNYVPKIGYYVDYVERRGVPEGVGPLNKSELPGMYAYYKIESLAHRVREMRHENASGKLITHDQVFFDRPARIVYTYGDDGELNQVICYNADDREMLVNDYAGLNTIDLRSNSSANDYSAASFQSAHSATALTNMFEATPSEQVSQSNVSRYLVDYDENGFVRELRYVSNPATQAVGMDADGVSGLRYERDELGRTVRISYLAYTGSHDSAVFPEDYDVVALRNGVSAMEYSYDGDNNLAGMRYIGDDGNPVLCEGGYAGITFRYEKHNPVEVRCFDVNGQPVAASGDCAIMLMAYDDRGYMVRMTCLGVDGEPALNKDGIAGYTVEYDERGNQTRICFLGTDGQPMLNDQGYAGWTNKYNERGQEIWTCVFGTDGEPCQDYNGVTISTAQYDENGNLTEIRYHNADGEPIIANDGTAGWFCEYNERGYTTRAGYFDLDGKPMPDEDGVASWTYEYDARGNVALTRFFGVDGEPVMSNGYSSCATEHDGRGNVTRIEYFGVDGEPVIADNGCASMTREYDDLGNDTITRCLGLDGEPVLGTYGSAYFTREYDEHGNLTKESFFGIDDEPVLSTEGYASRTILYDENGNVLEEQCFDENGERIMESVESEE